MSDSDVELRRLVNALPQYEEQIRYWESQLDAISNVKTDIFQAQDTINGMIKSDKSIGYVTSGGFAHFVNKSIAFSYIDQNEKKLDLEKK